MVLEDVEAAAEVQDEYWVENMSEVPSVFVGDSGKFRLEAHGYVGSISQVDRKVAFDPYVKRAISRDKLQMLTPQEAMERMEQLHIRDDDDSSTQTIRESLAEGASENVGRYRRSDLPDEAEARGAVHSDEIWGVGKNKKKQQGQVVEADFPQQEEEDIQGPLSPEQVLTAPEKEEG